MSKLKVILSLLAALAIVAFGVTQSAFAKPSTSRSAFVSLSSSSHTFVSFSQFLTDVAHAHYSEYTRLATTQVQNQQAFAAMQAYILNMYVGVKEVSSFTLDGQYYDCITVSSQPSVRLLHIKQIAQPPPVSVQPVSDSSVRISESPLTLGLKDQFGNSISCENGTIPMQRITLENMVQFPTLRDFLSKGPEGPGSSGHRHAAAYQNVANHGGDSILNLWNPSGYFSLSQQWYAGGSGTGTQTVEGGWIHDPGKWGSKSVLFIYWTADDYQSTGCYNLLCGAFVETNHTWSFGAPFSVYSTYGGTQYSIKMSWSFFEGNWWLFLPISGTLQPIGYYRGSIYKSGPLSQGASGLIVFGGEAFSPTPPWPQMGSGKFASAGWQQAAFQKNVAYIPSNSNGTLAVAATLSPFESNPSCYTVKITPYSGSAWGTYFYFGGPGGNC